MINLELGINFNPDLSGPIGSREPRRKRRETRISDYLLPVSIVEFPTPLPTLGEPVPAQPLGLMELVMPHVSFRTLQNGAPRKESFQYDYDLVLVENGDNPVLAVQKGSRTILARQALNTAVQAELKSKIQHDFPDEYARLEENIQPADDPRRKAPEAWNASLTVLISKHDNEAFDLIHQVAAFTNGGSVRIESYVASASMHITTVRPDQSSVFSGTPLYEERLIPRIFTCYPIEVNGQRVIIVGAHLPWIGYEDTGDKTFDTHFFVLEDGIAVPDEEMDKMLARLESEGRDIVAEQRVEDARAYLERWVKNQWDNNARNPITRRETRYRGPAAIDTVGPYVLDAFGKELEAEDEVLERTKSVRVFDAEFNRPTVRDVAEVAQEIYMIDAEIAEADSKQAAEEAEMKNWWVNKMLPLYREWDEEKIADGVEFLRNNAQDPLSLIADKLRGSTRLVVLGLARHPLQDDLVAKILQLPDINFVAVEARSPDDKAHALQEETLFTQVDVGEGVVMEVSLDEAKRKYPNRHRDPNKPQHFLDSVMGRARVRGLDVVYAVAGDTYKEVTANMGQTVTAYMTNHPGSKGVLFTTLLHAIKWPGHETPEDEATLDSNRPFVDHYSLANAHYSDTTVRMPAHILHTNFSGEIYSLTQLEMPKGYGEEWRNLRTSIAALGDREPFSIDNITASPFAEQWRILRLFPELESWPIEDLWQVVGPYCGPAKIDWGKLIDGVVVYPSDKPLPRRQTQEEFLEKAGGVIADIIRDKVGGEEIEPELVFPPQDDAGEI